MNKDTSRQKHAPYVRLAIIAAEAENAALTDLPQRHGRRLPDWQDVTLIAGGQMNAQRSAITR